MKSFSDLAQSVRYRRKGSKILLDDKHPDLQLVGKGRSAYVFKIHGTTKVLKLFFSPFEHLAKEEAEVYKVLGNSKFFVNLYKSGDNYLVIDYIAGNTVFECLVKGIPIQASFVEEVDKALLFARKQGLNPSDIHLRNIIITLDGAVKLIDVARFRQTKYCLKWNDLKVAYKYFYRYMPKKTPAFLLNLIAFLYKKKLIPPLTSAKFTSSSYSRKLKL